MSDLMKQSTYPQNMIFKRVKIDFGPFRRIFDGPARNADFVEVNVLINGVPLPAGCVPVSYFLLI